MRGITENIFQGFVFQINGFKSKIIMMFSQDMEVKVRDKRKRQQIKNIWQSIKHGDPGCILIDSNGNPLEEVLKQEETIN
ncbi:MAG: hypothetical protein KGZ85_04305 [Ignavibacterium sp.]|nr:hypothetical protein [Ignavibacterium sp.]